MGFALCLFGGLPDECCLFGLCFVCWVAVVFRLRFPRFVFGICFGCLVISTYGFGCWLGFVVFWLFGVVVYVVFVFVV